MKQLKLIYPLTRGFRISQKFGENKNLLYKKLGMLGHGAIDYAVPNNTPVYAMHDGEVIYAGVGNFEGYGVVIRTLETFAYKNKSVYFKSIYWHLEKDIPIRVGQKVSTGDLIGYSNNTGRSTGPHLHSGLKPTMVNEYNMWYNVEQNNGYKGGIDSQPFFDNYYPEDVKIMLLIIEKLKKILYILKILKKVVK